jgi:hypothetical protein
VRRAALGAFLPGGVLLGGTVLVRATPEQSQQVGDFDRSPCFPLQCQVARSILLAYGLSNVVSSRINNLFLGSTTGSASSHGDSPEEFLGLEAVSVEGA